MTSTTEQDPLVRRFLKAVVPRRVRAWFWHRAWGTSDLSLRHKEVADRVGQLVPRTGWLLDVGGRTLGLSPLLSGHVSPRVVVVNLDRSLLTRPGPSEMCVVADGTRLPFRSDTFGVSTCIDVLEHVPAPLRPALLYEMKRVTTSAVILHIPNAGTSRLFDRILYALSRDEHIRALTLDHLVIGTPRVGEIASVLPGCRVRRRRNAWLWLLLVLAYQAPRLRHLVAGLLYASLGWLDRCPPFYATMVEWCPSGAPGIRGHLDR